MIDFRFHLISLVAVFLALGLGILMGSVVLDQQLVKILQNDISDLRNDKQDLQDDVISLEQQLKADTRFAETAEEWLIADALSGREVIVLRFAGTDDRVTEGVAGAIERAGGSVAAEVTFTEQFSVAGVAERDQLALSVESTSGRPAEIRTDAASFIGTRLASAATSGGREGRVDAADTAAVNLLLELEEGGFVELNGIDEDGAIPDANLVLLGGGSEPPPFNLPAFSSALVQAAVNRGAAIVAAESSDSVWDLIGSLRSSDVADEVSTVDHAETVAGRIAAALALRDAAAGVTDHFGTSDGAGDIIPRPSPLD